MLLPRTALAASLSAFVLLGTVACTAAEAAPPVDEETYVSGPTASEDPVVETPGPLEPDMTLVIAATATTANGSTMDLELRVHQSYPWDDVASQTVPAAILQDCAGQFSAEQFAAETWSFTRANISGVLRDASAEWPSDAAVGISPSAAFVPLAGRGTVIGDPASTESPLCRQDKVLPGPGLGAIAFGIPGDAAAATAWTQHRFGFASDTVTLSECEITVLPLAEQYGASTARWIEDIDASTCSTGPAQETVDY